MAISGITTAVFIGLLLVIVTKLNSDDLKKKESLMILCAIAVSVGFDILNNKVTHFPWYIQLGASVVFAIATTVILILSNERFKKNEEKKSVVIQLITQIVKGLEPEAVSVEIKKDMPESIQFTIDTTYNEENTSAILNRLRTIYPDVVWDGTTEMNNFMVKIETFPHAPWPAKYPGSEFRSWQWIPLGLSHLGELGWNLGAKREGRSSYYYSGEKHPAETVESASAPQGLIVGSTGGGKAVELNQQCYIIPA